MKRYCFALDLKDDPESIVAYKRYHQEVWPAIVRSIKDAGILDLEIYCVSNRLFMIMEVDSFPFLLVENSEWIIKTLMCRSGRL